MLLHLGCGERLMPGWFNLDISPPPGGIKQDLTKRLPYVDESVDHIFTEHFIEHITFDEGVALMSECARVLKKDGRIRISTPCLRHLIEQYLSDELIDLPGIWSPRCGAAMVNEGLSLWGHKFVHDFESLSMMMSLAGLRDIAPQDYRKSDFPALCGLEHRPYMGELILEARA